MSLTNINTTIICNLINGQEKQSRDNAYFTVQSIFFKEFELRIPDSTLEDLNEAIISARNSFNVCQVLTFEERRKSLKGIVKEIPGRIVLVEQKLVKTEEELGKFYNSVLREGVETVIFLGTAGFTAGGYSLIGSIGGIALAVFLGFLLFVEMVKIDLRKVFLATSILLVFMGKFTRAVLFLCTK